MRFQPAFHLLHRVWIFKSCQFAQLFSKMLFCTIADTNCITDKRQIKLNAAVVDFLVKVVH